MTTAKKRSYSALVLVTVSGGALLAAVLFSAARWPSTDTDRMRRVGAALVAKDGYLANPTDRNLGVMALGEEITTPRSLSRATVVSALVVDPDGRPVPGALVCARREFTGSSLRAAAHPARSLATSRAEPTLFASSPRTSSSRLRGRSAS